MLVEKDPQLNYSILSTFITKTKMSNYKDKNHQECMLDDIYKDSNF